MLCSTSCILLVHSVSTVTVGLTEGAAEGVEVGYTEGRGVGLRVRNVLAIRGAEEVGTLVLGTLVG